MLMWLSLDTTLINLVLMLIGAWYLICINTFKSTAISQTQKMHSDLVFAWAICFWFYTKFCHNVQFDLGSLYLVCSSILVCYHRSQICLAIVMFVSKSSIFKHISCKYCFWFEINYKCTSNFRNPMSRSRYPSHAKGFSLFLNL